MNKFNDQDESHEVANRDCNNNMQSNYYNYVPIKQIENYEPNYKVDNQSNHHDLNEFTRNQQNNKNNVYHISDSDYNKERNNRLHWPDRNFSDENSREQIESSDKVQRFSFEINRKLNSKKEKIRCLKEKLNLCTTEKDNLKNRLSEYENNEDFNKNNLQRLNEREREMVDALKKSQEEVNLHYFLDSSNRRSIQKASE